MSFATRDFSTTLTGLLAMFIATNADVTDIRPGSVIHSFFAAVAMASVRTSEDLAALVAQGQDAAAFNAFGFGTQPAQAAYGSVTLVASPAPTAPIAIPLGALFGVPGTTLQFRSTAAATFPAGGALLEVPVVAALPGPLGNVGAGAVSLLVTPLPGITAVANGRPFTTGRAAQTDGERRQAFREYVATLHRGTKQSLAVGAASAQLLDPFGVPIEQVTKVAVAEAGAGATVAIYGLGTAASPALVARCQTVIDGDFTGNLPVPGYKAAGTRVTVVAALPSPVVVQVLVNLLPGFVLAVVQPLVVDAVHAVFARLDIGDDLPLNRLRTAIGNVVGIDQFAIQSPTFSLYGDGATLFTLVDFSAFGTPPLATASYVGVF
jgi:uncharacterized phage protein gp47/JayE